MDPTIYRITYSYPSTLGPLPCEHNGEAIVNGMHNATMVLDALREEGVTSVFCEPFAAPPAIETMKRIKKSLAEFPIRETA